MRNPVPAPSCSARCNARCARPSAMTERSACEPAPMARRAEPTLGTMPPAMMPSSMSCAASEGVSSTMRSPSAPRDPVGVGHEHQFAAECGADSGRGVVGVDVADAPVRVQAHGRQHGQVAGLEQRVQQRGVRHRLADDAVQALPRGGRGSCRGRCRALPTASPPRSSSASVSSALMTPLMTARKTSSVASSVTRRPCVPLALDAQALEPFGEALAAAVDDHHGSLAPLARRSRAGRPAARRWWCRPA